MTKKFFDLFIVFLFSPLWAPLLCFLVIASYFLTSKKPIFYQLRAGLHGKPFYIYKIKTMIDAIDNNGKTLPDEARVTRFGNFLRSSSLDELPSLLNVLRGEISLVGPRPLYVHYIQYYNSNQKKRMLVKPGLTGWAQINGRNNISWDEKFKLDVFYVDHRSLWFDLKIIFITIIKVLKKEGISPQGQLTMTEFKGC